MTPALALRSSPTAAAAAFGMYICTPTATPHADPSPACPRTRRAVPRWIPCRCRSTPSAAWDRPRAPRRSSRRAGSITVDIFCRYDSRRSSTRVSSLSKSSSRCPPMRTGRSYSSTNESSRSRMPLWPSRSFFHVPSASVARGSRHGNAGDDNIGEPVPRSQPTHFAAMVPFPPTPQYLPKASATLCPPNPNELLIAYLKSPYRGSPATTSRSISGSGVS